MDYSDISFFLDCHLCNILIRKIRGANFCHQYNKLVENASSIISFMQKNF